MTFAMSTEGDSVKSALSEANDKNATDNHTDDSSQDSMDTKEVEADKPVENNVNSAKDEKPKDESTEGESEQESELSEKREEPDGASKEDQKPEENDNKREEDQNAAKKEEKEVKSEEDEEGEDEEDEEDSSKKEEKPVKESKKAGKDSEKDEKASTASEKDEEEDEADEEEEEEEDDDEEEDEKPDKKGKKKGVPLLDQPLETSGKRERKNVQRFEEDVKKEPPKVEFEDGPGTSLGEIPRVEASIARAKNDDLKLLHRLLFKVAGNKNTHKKNIKQFNGFSFEKDSDEFKKKLELLKKSEAKHLKITCEVLDLIKTGTKDDMAERIMDFLVEPKDSGKPLGGTGRPKRASAVRANNRGYSSHDDYSSDERHTSRARRDKGKRANLKDESSSDEEFKPGNGSDASDEKPRAVSKRKRGRPKKGSSEEDEASLSGVSSDESDDLPKSKRRKSITKSNSRAKPKTASRRGRPSKSGSSTAATARSKTKRGRKPKDVSSDEEEDEKIDEGSSSEDEPLAKKKAKSSEPPTDDEIKTFIKSVLEGANLEEITMKTVCQRVYDNYPDFDLTARKNFIKSTVKSLIST